MYKFVLIISFLNSVLPKPCSDPLSCPDSRLPCRASIGNKPQHYHYWQQGDGVCDCCDGSDEPEGACENICDRLDRQEKAEKRQREVTVNMGRVKKLSLQRQSDGSADYKAILERLAKDKDIERALLDYSSARDRNDCSLFTPLWRRPTVTVTVTQTTNTSKSGIWSLLPECIVKQFGKYEYSFCPFQNITQRELNGRNSIVLGYFEHLDVQKMQFGNGQSCWNGPSRSVIVDFECAPVEEIVQVEEPEKCTYRMLVKTCAIC